jgi:carbamoylphosphate synthase small subunit
MTIIIFALNKKYKPMQIVNIEAGTFTEMISALQSLKNKMGKLQEVYSEKKMDEWLDNREVCMILGISLRTLQSLRSNGTLSFTQIDRKVYYHKQDVISLLETIKNKK